MTRRHAFIVVPSAVLGLALLASACGSSTNDAGDSASAAVVEATSPIAAPAAPATSAAPAGEVGSIGDAIEVAAGAPAQANDAACVADRQTLEAATEMYSTLNGANPASQTDLMDAGLIKELSPRFEITPEGVIVPSAGSPCI